MFGQILNLDGVEVTKSAVEGDIGEVDASDLHALQQFTTEVQTCGGCCDGTFVLGVDGLEVLHIFRSGLALVDDVSGQRGSTQGEEFAGLTDRQAEMVKEWCV